MTSTISSPAAAARSTPAAAPRSTSSRRARATSWRSEPAIARSAVTAERAAVDAEVDAAHPAPALQHAGAEQAGQHRGVERAAGAGLDAGVGERLAAGGDAAGRGGGEARDPPDQRAALEDEVRLFQVAAPRGEPPAAAKPDDVAGVLA